MIFTKEFLKSMESLSLFPEKSSEAISDQMDTTPVGGDLESDATGKSEETNEQNNELDSGMDFGDDSGDGFGSENNSENANGDLSGNDGDMSTGENNSSKTITLEPFENPFKAQNGKNVLDSMFEKLQNAIKDTISKIHANSNVKIVVVSQFDDLLDNVDKARETVYVLPKEASMVKYRLCVELYKKLCDSLCNDITNGSNSR